MLKSFKKPTPIFPLVVFLILSGASESSWARKFYVYQVAVKDILHSSDTSVGQILATGLKNRAYTDRCVDMQQVSRTTTSTYHSDDGKTIKVQKTTIGVLTNEPMDTQWVVPALCAPTKQRGKKCDRHFNVKVEETELDTRNVRMNIVRRIKYKDYKTPEPYSFFTWREKPNYKYFRGTDQAIPRLSSACVDGKIGLHRVSTIMDPATQSFFALDDEKNRGPMVNMKLSLGKLKKNDDVYIDLGPINWSAHHPNKVIPVFRDGKTKHIPIKTYKAQ